MAKTLLLAFFMFLLSVEGSNRYGSNRVSRNKPVTRLFVFGDSYADTGNIDKSLASSWKLPYGITFPGKPSGRFSDGRVLTDHVAKYLGFTSPIPYARRKLAPRKARHGVNFAYGGTGALNTLATIGAGLPNMSTQIDYFQHMLHGKDVVRIRTNLTKSVALVSLVGNDYGTYVTTHNGSKKHLGKYIKKVVRQLASDLQRLKRLGFKKILATGMQPLGCLPQRTASTSFKHCSKRDNKSVKLHNHLLLEAVVKLNKRSPNSRPPFVILDLYNSFFDVFDKNHGGSGSLRFKNSLKPCCFGIDVNSSCGDVDQNGNKLYTLCDDPTTTFFWDSHHPTNAGWREVYVHLKPTLKHALY